MNNTHPTETIKEFIKSYSKSLAGSLKTPANCTTEQHGALILVYICDQLFSPLIPQDNDIPSIKNFKNQYYSKYEKVLNDLSRYQKQKLVEMSCTNQDEYLILLNQTIQEIATFEQSKTG